jgi:hypothetical protein
VARLEEIQWVIGRQMRASGSSSRAWATARPAVRATGDQTAQGVQIGVVTAQARAAWIQTGVEAVIASEIEVYRRVRVAAQRAAPLAVLRAVGAAPAPAAPGAHQVWAVHAAVAVVAGDGGNSIHEAGKIHEFRNHGCSME